MTIIEFAHGDIDGIHKMRVVDTGIHWMDGSIYESWTYGRLSDLQQMARRYGKGKLAELYFPKGAKCP